jgi:hypothetical protein
VKTTHWIGCLCLLVVALPRPAAAQNYVIPAYQSYPASAVANVFQEGNGNGDTKKKNGNGNGNGKDNDKDKEPPKHIRDNAILVEEAFNQETGEAQHIFTWNFLCDRNRLGRSRDFIFAYTLELPIGSQTHQFSITSQFLTLLDKPLDGPPVRQGDIGDTFLHYRYQLLDDDEFLWCAPRLSLILPTADRRFGVGAGQVGYQFNLPVSRYGENFDFHFNAGFTYIPNVSVPLAPGLFTEGRDLRAYNLGGSIYWKPQVDLHFYVETLALWFDVLDERGTRGHLTQVYLNPGLRYAVIQDPVEWVLGVSIPVGLTRDTPDIGVFVYMSIEHTFRKKNGD